MSKPTLALPRLRHARSGGGFAYESALVVMSAEQLSLGGAMHGAVHDIAGQDQGAGFAAFLLRDAARVPVLWAGDRLDLYPPGLMWWAFDPARLIFAETSLPEDRLGALEIALRGGMHGVAVVEHVSRLAARRLALAARCGGGLGLVLRPGKAIDSTAFSARWQVTAVRSGPSGRPRRRAELLYARGRPPSVFLIEADRHATPLSLAVVSERPATAGATRWERLAG